LELNPPPFRLQPEIAARHLATVPLRGHGAVDPERQRLALAGDLERVPLAGLLAALRAGPLVVRDADQLAALERLAEEVADILAPDLGLVPDLAVGRVADVHPAVVALLALHLLQAPPDVEDAVAELVIVQQHLVDAHAVADQVAGLRVDAPGVARAQLAPRRDRHAFPALEVLAREQVNPALRVGLQGALGRLLLARGRPQERQHRHKHYGQWKESVTHGSPPFLVEPSLRPVITVLDEVE